MSAEQVTLLVELLKSPPAGKEEELLDLLSNRVPAGVDDAAYVKAGFLAAVAKGEANSPLIMPLAAVELLGTMRAATMWRPWWMHWKTTTLVKRQRGHSPIPVGVVLSMMCRRRRKQVMPMPGR